ncbi:hypothetical protein CE195_03340 [Sodalis-like symbiont of Philaenus spumarius]|nr:hypothetical protein CE195_03340 [Sodalis-like symbiont of Philaenus spumarius]
MTRQRALLHNSWQVLHCYLAYTFGPRTDETCRELLALLRPFNIGIITSDN